MQQRVVGDAKGRRGAALAVAGVAAVLAMAAAGCSASAIGAPSQAAKSGAAGAAATASAGASGSAAAAGSGNGASGGSGGSVGGAGGGAVGAGSSSRPGGTSECAASVLTISAVAGPSGAGHSSELLRFSNVGGHACFVRGYPGVAQVHGSQTLQNATRTRSGYLGGLAGGQSIPAVVLNPGQSASALVEALDAATDGSSACAGAGATGLLVTAPDQTSSKQLPSLLTACAGFQVHPIVGGSSGSSGSGGSGGSGGSQDAGGLQVDITPEGGISVTPGGSAATFTVLLHNPTATDWAQVGLVVSFGHCSCTASTLFPSGTLNVVDPRFSGSQSAPYNVEGFGTDFLNATAVPAIAIMAGTTDIFTFHVQLSAAQAAHVSSGTSNVDVTLTDAANNQPVGPSPLASLPISVG